MINNRKKKKHSIKKQFAFIYLFDCASDVAEGLKRQSY